MLKATRIWISIPRTYIFASKAAPGYFMAKKPFELMMRFQRLSITMEASGQNQV
jgi:glucan phosphorylase